MRSVIVTADFKDRLVLPRVAVLATQLKTCPLIEPINVRVRTSRGYALISGGDRLAAHVLLNRRKILAQVWDVTDQQAREMALVEQAYRRADPVERATARQELLDMYSAGGELREPLAVAEDVAAARAKRVNAKPESVARVERRRRQRAREGSAPVSQLTPQPLDTMGITLTSEWLAMAEDVRHGIYRAQDALVRSNASLAAATRLPLANRELLLRMHEEIRVLAARLKGLVPVSVCPYCKVLDGLLEHCAACSSTGLLTADQLRQIPSELRRTGSDAVVIHAGRWYRVDEWIARQQSGKVPERAPDEDRPPQQDEWEFLDGGPE